MRGLERDRPLGTKVTFWKLLRFFLPLGATPFLIASTHSIVDGALARLPNPEVNIAVFGIVKSMVNVIKAPELMSTQVFLAFVDDQKSYRLVRRFNWQVISVVFFLLSLLGYTPLGGLVLQYVFKIDDPDQLDLAYRALRIAAFLPFVETLRNAYQGMAVGLVRTGIMAVATAMRVVVLFFFLSWVVAGQVFTGIEAGSIAWVAGIGFELLIILSYFVWSFGSLSRGVTHLPSKDHGELTMGMVRNFFIPLGVMSLIAALIPSVIQAGIARFSLAPAEDLAGYAVALSLMTVIVGPARSLHQCLFVYGADEEGVVRRFCLLVGLVLTLVMLSLALTPLGNWVFGSVIGVSPTVTKTARGVLGVFALFPIACAWREFCWGIIMQNGSTGIIGRAKTANLIAAVVALLTSLVLSVHPAIAGAIGYTSGEIVESLVIWHHPAGSKALRQRMTIQEKL
ncbi:MAG TPA: hypothetical protein GXX57_02680 [Firmicutes bacterium]|nr:hypothetical protein [Bacillota bacterium]